MMMYVELSSLRTLIHCDILKLSAEPNLWTRQDHRTADF